MKRSQSIPHVPWWLRPLWSRQRFSPRLLVAWQSFYVAVFLAIWATVREPKVLNGVVVPGPTVIELVIAFLGTTTLCLGLGTLQVVKLGDAPVDAPPDSPVPPETE